MVSRMTDQEIEHLMSLPASDFSMQAFKDELDMESGLGALLFQGKWRLAGRTLKPVLVFGWQRLAVACLHSPWKIGRMYAVVSQEGLEGGLSPGAGSAELTDEEDEFDAIRQSILATGDADTGMFFPSNDTRWDDLHRKRLARMQAELMMTPTSLPNEQNSPPMSPRSSNSSSGYITKGQRGGVGGNVTADGKLQLTTGVWQNIRLLMASPRHGFRFLFTGLGLQWGSKILGDLVRVVANHFFLGEVWTSWLVAITRLPLDAAFAKRVLHEEGQREPSVADCIELEGQKRQHSSMDRIRIIIQAHRSVPVSTWVLMFLERSISCLSGSYLLSLLPLGLPLRPIWAHFMLSLPLLVTIPMHNLSLRMLASHDSNGHSNIVCADRSTIRVTKWDSLWDCAQATLTSQRTAYVGWRWHLLGVNYRMLLVHLKEVMISSRHHLYA